MNNTPLLLVTAIVAIALVAFMTGLLNPWINPAGDLGKALEKSLSEALVIPGKFSTPTTVRLRGGESVTTPFLSTNDRIVGFACLDETYCCTQNSRCTAKAVVEKDRIMIREASPLLATIRCNPDNPIQTCVVFVGKTPPQVSIVDVFYPQVIRENPLVDVNVVVKNTGDVTLKEDVNVVVGLYKSLVQNGVESYGKVRETMQLYTDDISPSQDALVPLTLTVLSEGKYQLRIRVSSNDGGFDEYNVPLQAGATTSLCRAVEPQEAAATLSTGECAKKSPCQGTCLGSFECQNAWQIQYPARVFDSGAPTYAYEIVNENECA